MRLNELTSSSGATKARKRVGRGPGSGTGKTSGAGHKGQKARTGVSLQGFEGGQTVMYRRLPKRGFNNIFRTEYSIVNLSQLQSAIDAGKLDGKQAINKDTLLAAGLVRRLNQPVKLLGQGEIKTAFNIEVDRASASAVAAIEKAKGSVKQLIPAVENKDSSSTKKR